MKKTLLLPVLMGALLLWNCKGEKTDGNSKDTLNIKVETNDSTMWGRIGEESSQRVIQFITEQNDTLELYMTSEETGEEAEVVGDILRNFDNPNSNDKIAVMVRGVDIDGGCSIKKIINVSQMMGVWTDADNKKLAFFPDKTANSDENNYKQWSMKNCQIILTGSNTNEITEQDRIDTLTVVELNDDSLKLLSSKNEIYCYGRNND